MAATRRSSRLANTKPPVKTLPVRPAISRKRARPAKSPQGLPTPKSVTPAVIATPTAQLTPPEPSPEDVVEPPKKRSRTSKPAKTPSETPLELSQPEASTCQAPVPAPAPALAPYTPKIGIQDLPLDITHTIFSYLQYHRIRHGKSIVDHPFVILSKTSHALRKAIESYSRHAYPAVRQRFADRLAPEEIDQRLSLPPSALWGETEFDHSPPNNSHTLLVADVLVNFCAFCAKRADCTYREYAKFATDVPCCPECDKEEWPQISLSKAVTEYNLGKVKTKILEEVRHAKFELNRTWTTVLLVKDVEDFAEKVHGCTIEDYFEAKEGRKKKRADSKTILAEHRRQELHAFIELNELDVSPQDLQDLENLIVEGSFAYTSTMMRSYMIRKKINYNAYLDLLEQLRIERFSGPVSDTYCAF